MNVCFFSLTHAKPRKYGLQCFLRGDFAAGDFAAGDFGEGREAVAEVLRHEVGGEAAGEAALHSAEGFEGAGEGFVGAEVADDDVAELQASCQRVPQRVRLLVFGLLLGGNLLATESASIHGFVHFVERREILLQYSETAAVVVSLAHVPARSIAAEPYVVHDFAVVQ